MVTAARVWTYDDIEALPDDGKRYEAIYGELHASAAPDRRHQKLQTMVVVRIFNVSNAVGNGEVYVAPVDVRPLGTDQVQPDIIFIGQDRLHLYQGHVLNGPPDLVVEILSPSTRHIDEGQKFRFYAEAGVPEYWIFDPRDREVRPFALVDGAYEPIPPEPDGTFRSRVLPAFSIDPEPLFAEMDGERPTR